MTKDLRIAVGRRVRELRQKRNVSQEGLADKADLHRNYVGYVERAERSITIDSLGRLTRALDVSLSEFFEPFTGHFRTGRAKQRARRTPT